MRIVSSLGKYGIIPFWPFQNNLDFEKTKGVTGTRTRDIGAEGLDVLHYAIRSLETRLFYWIIIFFDINEIVIYFTIHDKFVLSRKLKI